MEGIAIREFALECPLNADAGVTIISGSLYCVFVYILVGTSETSSFEIRRGFFDGMRTMQW